jgi:hypothetical protein
MPAVAVRRIIMMIMIILIKDKTIATVTINRPRINKLKE